MTNGADSSRLAVEQVEIVMSALRHLTAEQMHTLVMLYYAELTLGQVAFIEGITPRAAQGRKARALERMRQELAKVEIVEGADIL